jgi:hypothetical protein
VFAEARRRHVLTVAGAEVSLAAVRFGFAFLEMGKSVKRPGLGYSRPGAAAEVGRPRDSRLRLRRQARTEHEAAGDGGVSGKEKQGKPILLHDVGWSLGKISVGAISNLKIDFTIAKAFRLRIEELGFIADPDGANYLMMSASIGTPNELANPQGSSPATPRNRPGRSKPPGAGSACGSSACASRSPRAAVRARACSSTGCRCGFARRSSSSSASAW